MKRNTIVLIALAALAAFGLQLTGCKDSDITAPGDGSLLLSANPGRVNIDTGAGATEGQSTITARVFDSGGLALQGVAVFFTTQAGSLASAGSPVKTNANGIARDTLTLTVNDPDEVLVTAESSSLAASVVVSKGQNQAPLAAIIDIPLNEQRVRQPVLFDGSASTDPDGQITCFQWTISTNLAGVAPEVVQGTGVSALDREYQDEQTLTVILRVSDQAGIAAECDGPTPLPSSRFSPNVAALQYQIVCNNTPPVAEAGPDIRVAIANAGTVFLDGSGSTDAERPLERYRWTCGNGTSPVIPNPAQPWLAVCRYFAVGNYVAELTVWDQGDGTIDPGNGAFGNWNCQRSAMDVTTVTVFDPAAQP